ncbi:MAG: hypothetical protein QM811_00420 [Pirellulales bacterium]
MRPSRGGSPCRPKRRWSAADAAAHAETSAKYHEAFHAAAQAKTNRPALQSEAEAKKKWIAEKYAESAARLEDARKARDEFHPGLWYGGIVLTLLGLGGWWATREGEAYDDE